MPGLLAKIYDIFLFLKLIVEVASFTGLGLASLIAFGYELPNFKRKGELKSL